MIRVYKNLEMIEGSSVVPVKCLLGKITCCVIDAFVVVVEKGTKEIVTSSKRGGNSIVM